MNDYNITEKVKKVSKDCVKAIKDYENNVINTELIISLLLNKRAFLIKVYNDNIDNMSDDDSHMLLLTLYTINSAIIKLLNKINKEVDELSEGRFGKKEYISNFDFEWTKQEE